MKSLILAARSTRAQRPSDRKEKRYVIADPEGLFLNNERLLCSSMPINSTKSDDFVWKHKLPILIQEQVENLRVAISIEETENTV